MKFLKNTKTEESLQVYEEHKIEDSKYKNILERALQQIKVSDKDEKASKLSHRSQAQSRTSSNSSSVAIRKRAKAEAAQAKLEFAMKEADLQKQKAHIEEQEKVSNAKTFTKKAELEAELELLNYKKEAAAATAEADALEYDQNVCGSKKSDLPLSKTVYELTNQYVEQQVLQVKDVKLPPDDNIVPCDPFANQTSGDAVHEHSLMPTPKPSRPKYDVPSVSAGCNDNDINIQVQEHALNPNAPQFQPDIRTHQNTPQIQPDISTHQNAPQFHPDISTHQNIATDLTRFLLKKDLLLSRLTTYSDRPEMYAVWKASFKKILSELSVTAMEELDLMVKWLGPEFTRHANSIRASNIHDPTKGLQRLWERLDERYGSPESVEASLMAKLNNFPKLTQKDNKKLYELVDILSEIESIKEDVKYNSLLAYFDSSSGVLPILNKLPYNIQEKWTNRASQYKREKQVTFPPFTLFVKFIRELSQIRNDPSFAYDQTNQPKKAYTAAKPPEYKTAISVHKTDVSSDLDLQKQCLLHKTGHSLNQCRAFKANPFQVRKKFINDHKICYGCCESTKHVKRTCTNAIRCSECGSGRHPGALHINRSIDSIDQNNNKSSSPVHGGEEKIDIQNDNVATKCTEICGTSFHGRSCAKILPVRVFRPGQHGRYDNLKLYIILDDQSNRSLASPLFFDTFGVHGTLEEYMLSSCSGRVKMSGRRASGFVVESLDGQVQLELPTLIECSDLPHNREETPTPDIAIRHNHLKDMADHLSPLDPDCEIMLLIGRDMTEAHHVLEQIYMKYGLTKLV
ncbi:uncharacterized protein LOC127712067 [Mytilus californianus]|uniref:uncharacterized protein LOC127712067 n=1 Tax=Mytilus californianus TaxID=6549 RepID=UPI0022454ED6|nr:uncharacterized protein LOC127712067 [Mytilus californianus]